jgi:hypothetical protein
MLGETVDTVGRVQRHPYGMVAGALGLGFVLGGGLFTRLTAGVVGVGLRIGLMAALPLVKEEIVRATQRALAGPHSDIKKEESQ